MIAKLELTETKDYLLFINRADDSNDNVMGYFPLNENAKEIDAPLLPKFDLNKPFPKGFDVYLMDGFSIVPYSNIFEILGHVELGIWNMAVEDCETENGTLIGNYIY